MKKFSIIKNKYLKIEKTLLKKTNRYKNYKNNQK